jgi:hypothetical protein
MMYVKYSIIKIQLVFFDKIKMLSFFIYKCYLYYILSKQTHTVFVIYSWFILPKQNILWELVNADLNDYFTIN